MIPNGREVLRTRRHLEAGFSLIEVMAALVILSIALTAVFATFISQQKSFTIQNRVAEMQANLRQAVEYISRDIRLAGYGIPGNVSMPAGTVAVGVTPMRWLYPSDNATGPDQLYLLYRFDMDANQPPTLLSADMGTVSATISVNSITSFNNGDLILVTDNAISTADLFKITAAPNGTTLPHDTNGYNASSLHPTFPAGGYIVSPAAMVAKARFVRYFIDSTTDPSHPTLMVDRMTGASPQPVADDIEDMQVQYNMDTDGNGALETVGVNNPATGNSGVTGIALNPSQIRQVRLLFIARSRLPEAGWSETRPALGNRPAGTSPDGYRRRIYDIVIDVRNSGA